MVRSPILSRVVESNHDEERIARIERMVEALQRESAALKIVTARLEAAVKAQTVPRTQAAITPNYRS